jgi:hypothetical protein
LNKPQIKTFTTLVDYSRRILDTVLYEVYKREILLKILQAVVCPILEIGSLIVYFFAVGILYFTCSLSRSAIFRSLFGILQLKLN